MYLNTFPFVPKTIFCHFVHFHFTLLVALSFKFKLQFQYKIGFVLFLFSLLLVDDILDVKLTSSIT